MNIGFDFLFTILESIGTFLITPPISIFLAIILSVLAIKIIRIIVDI